MPRQLLFAALLSLLVSPAGSAQKKSDREEGGLAGPVRAVEEYEAELSRDGGKIAESNRRLWSTETYDLDGRQLTSTFYKDDGGILDSDTYVYVARGRLIEKRTQQNTDAEDYAVYAAILNKHFEGERVRLLVIKRFTEGFRTNDPEERQQLSPGGASLDGAERATLDDYVEKNKRKQYELLDKLFALKGRHALVNDGELSAIFAKDCGKGWETFYQKYPNSQGVTTLSKVGFNKDRTQALVYVGTQSHCLAGAGHFIILVKQDGAWVVKRSSMLWIS